MSDQNVVLLNIQWWSGFNVFLLKAYSTYIEWIAYNPAKEILAVKYSSQSVSDRIYENFVFLYSIDQDQMLGFVKKANNLNSWEEAFGENIKDISARQMAGSGKMVEKCTAPSLEWMNNFDAAEFVDCGGLNEPGVPQDVLKFHNWLCSRRIDWDALASDTIKSEFSF